jgi:hypothetical protein
MCDFSVNLCKIALKRALDTYENNLPVKFSTEEHFQRLATSHTVCWDQKLCHNSFNWHSRCTMPAPEGRVLKKWPWNYGSSAIRWLAFWQPIIAVLIVIYVHRSGTLDIGRVRPAAFLAIPVSDYFTIVQVRTRQQTWMYFKSCVSFQRITWDRLRGPGHAIVAHLSLFDGELP